VVLLECVILWHHQGVQELRAPQTVTKEQLAKKMLNASSAKPGLKLAAPAIPHPLVSHLFLRPAENKEMWSAAVDRYF
jgi:hypothetical protein